MAAVDKVGTSEDLFLLATLILRLGFEAARFVVAELAEAELAVTESEGREFSFCFS